MPAALQKACAVFGCGETSPCQAHEGRRDRARGTAAERGYGATWRARSKAFLRRHPRCGDRLNGQPPVMSRCRDAGRITAAFQVDHVVPHRGDPTLFWDEMNWQALCRSCGAAKSRAGL